jgi:hypothetical protein
MRERNPIRRFAVERFTIVLVALALTALAVVPGGTTPAPCPERMRAELSNGADLSQGATVPPPSGLDPDEPRRPRKGIDLSLRVWNLRVEFPWMRALPISPGHHIVISLFPRESTD